MPRPTAFDPDTYKPTTRMVSDLVRVAQSPIEKIRAVADVLSREDGVLPLSRLYGTAATTLGDEETGHAVGNTILILTRESPAQRVKELRALKERYPDRMAPLTDELLSALTERLEVLSIPFP